MEELRQLRLEHETHDPNVDCATCVFCCRNQDEGHEHLVSLHEEELMKIVCFHINHWKRLGARMSNRVNEHMLPASIVAMIIYQWIRIPRLKLNDSPSDYLPR